MPSAFTDGEATQLIAKALEAGTIKLQGTTQCGHTAAAQRVAEIDGAYLVKLLNELQKAPAA